MKKLATTILLSAAAAVAANAQTSADALRYSTNNYYGTARTMAMGNAFTALGGDLGSLGINPAGSAVNSFSQVTISPSVSIVSTREQVTWESRLFPTLMEQQSITARQDLLFRISVSYSLMTQAAEQD